MIKKTIKITIIIMVITFSLGIISVLAVTQDDINAKKNEIENATEELDEVEKNLQKTTEKIKELEQEISGYETDIDELDAQINEVSGQIDEATIALQEAEEKYNNQKANFAERLVAIYEAGETTYLDVLLSSDDILDFITNYYLIEEMAECDNNMLDLMEKNRIDIENAKSALETNKQQIEALRTSKANKMEALQGSQAIQQQYASELEEQEEDLQERIDELTAEQEQMESELRAAQNRYSSEIADLGGTGTLQRPVSGGVVTCNMYYSSGKYHGAMDIGVPVGTKVYAAADGIVLTAGWNNTGYGYLTVIQHGDGLRTYYGHGCGTYYVKPGDKVEKGQLIMLSGSTGNSSGPHLHFEVRVAPYSWVYGGGSGDCRRDPRNYL